MLIGLKGISISFKTSCQHEQDIFPAAGQHGSSNTWSCVFVFLCCQTEPTKITVPPLSVDATVGQSIVLPCEVSRDSSLDPTFKWFFNGKLIDFNKQDHFEMIGGVCTYTAFRKYSDSLNFSPYQSTHNNDKTKKGWSKCLQMYKEKYKNIT